MCIDCISYSDSYSFWPGMRILSIFAFPREIVCRLVRGGGWGRRLGLSLLSSSNRMRLLGGGRTGCQLVPIRLDGRDRLRLASWTRCARLVGWWIEVEWVLVERPRVEYRRWFSSIDHVWAIVVHVPLCFLLAFDYRYLLFSEENSLSIQLFLIIDRILTVIF